MTTCLVVQHAAPESAFTIEDALHETGVSVETLRVFEGDVLPETTEGLDGLVVMGGSMAAYSDQGFPSRTDELILIADAISSRIPTLGVCLGAQLVAMAAGASAHRGELGAEIGWLPITSTEECLHDQLFAGIPEKLTVLQWHGDTFDLPAGAALLMSSTKYPNQAFRIGEVVWGLQFHLEVDEAAVECFLNAFGSELQEIAGGSDGIRRQTRSGLAALRPWRDLVIGRFAGLVAARVTGSGLVAGRTDLNGP
jgi:GMP synthase-like glutamine amidotransferase